MDPFLKELAQARPDPGGGAAAAYGAGLGLALLAKVLRLEARRRPNPKSEPPAAWGEGLTELQRLAGTLQKLQQEDVRAYFELTAARASGDADRLATAVQEAVACPRRIAAQAFEGLELLAWAGERCQQHLASDLLVAGEFLGAALRGALHIAAANLPLVPAGASRRALAAEMNQHCREGEDLYRRVQAALLDKMKLHNCPDI